MQTLLYLYIGSSFILILIALPLLARKIKPNPFYGFRIRKTLEDSELWYSVNQYFAKHLLITGFLQTIASILFYVIPDISIDAYALSCLGVFVILFAVAMIKSLKYIRELNNQS